MDAEVNALCVFDDCSGPALYAGGAFGIAGGVAASSIARWSGSSWSALRDGLIDGVRALTLFDNGSGPTLVAGGVFGASSSGDSYVARWGCGKVRWKHR